MSEGELILYNTEDVAATVGLRAVVGAVWLTQLEIAELFNTSKQNVSLHLNNVLAEGELDEKSVVKDSSTTGAGCKAYDCSERATLRKFRIVQTEGARQVELRRVVSMAEWADKLDAFLTFNERDVLTHAGRLRMDVAQKLAAERFEAFDAHRRAAEAIAADADDIAHLEEIEKVAKGRKKRGEDV